MVEKVNHLDTGPANLFILKVLSILSDRRYSQLVYWPFENISLDALCFEIIKINQDYILKKDFIKFCLQYMQKKKHYSIIEGIINLMRLCEELERYEDCIVLKEIKDDILLDLTPVM